jgi:hypothetical protein
VVAAIQPILENIGKFYQSTDFALGDPTLADFQVSEFSHYV